jgi:hypothetical protein
MTQVALIVRDALQLLGVVDANEAPEAEDAAAGVRALNLMMRAWEVDGLSMGWQDVATVTEELPAPPEAEEAITYNLALRLRPKYGVVLEADVIQQARDGLATLNAQILSTEYNRLEYPDLPYGTAQRNGSWRDGYYK